MKPLHLLLLFALGSPLLALLPDRQDPATTDWAKEVERACTAQRYGLRLAAGKKVAQAGGVAVPALRAYAQARGRNELPASLLDAIAEANTIDLPVLELLLEWATDKDFYWRATALKGLARRGPLLPEVPPTLRTLLVEATKDPAWLFRVHGRHGLALLEQAAVDTADPDLRAVVKLTALQLQAGKMPSLQPLLDALDDDRTMLGDPSGQRLAREAFDALKLWLGDQHPLPAGEAFADRPAAIAALLEAARRKSGQDLQTPPARRDPERAWLGGIELLSCRHGDWFAQWNGDGKLYCGPDSSIAVELPAAAWAKLEANRKTLDLTGDLGNVVCDNLRLRWTPPLVHVKVAPASLPTAVTDWLQELAVALHTAGHPQQSAQLLAGLEQFKQP